ncbi:MAG: hypothetical protein JWM95_2416 [Gemmatimonadetes bacterium]|nr:hypothetical protein [Gemmatimonadota bacterium]
MPENTELETLRRRLATETLRAELASTLDPEYASVMAARHAERVQVTSDGVPDTASVATVAREIATNADPRWRQDASTGEGAFFDNLRATLKARQSDAAARRERAASALDRLAGGR